MKKQSRRKSARQSTAAAKARKQKTPQPIITKANRRPWISGMRQNLIPAAALVAMLGSTHEHPEPAQ